MFRADEVAVATRCNDHRSGRGECFYAADVVEVAVCAEDKKVVVALLRAQDVGQDEVPQLLGWDAILAVVRSAACVNDYDQIGIDLDIDVREFQIFVVLNDQVGAAIESRARVWRSGGRWPRRGGWKREAHPCLSLYANVDEVRPQSPAPAVSSLAKGSDVANSRLAGESKKARPRVISSTLVSALASTRYARVVR